MALACSDTKVSAKSHFRHFWVIDLTSEVTRWPRTLNFGVNGFVSWQATRWFFNRSSSSPRSQSRRGGGSSHQPPVPWRMAKWRVPARVKTLCVQALLTTRCISYHLYHLLLLVLTCLAATSPASALLILWYPPKSPPCIFWAFMHYLPSWPFWRPPDRSALYWPLRQESACQSDACP